MGCGHVAPSCARRCAGSRLPDHARCSFFVRSRHHARVRPRRAIHLSAGALCGPHQRSHKCAWLRTTFSSTRGQGRRIASCEVVSSSSIRRATCEHNLWALKEPRRHRAALHAACVLPLFADMPACCHCPATPAMPHPISLLPALPGPRPLDAPCTGRSRSQHPPGPPGRLRLHCVCVCVLVDVMSQCRLMCLLLSGRLPFAKRLLPRSVVSAADLLSLSDSVSGARVICCSPSRLSMLWCVLLRFLPVTHSCAYASLGGYTLCSIPGMHSSALSSPTHVSKVVTYFPS